MRVLVVDDDDGIRFIVGGVAQELPGAVVEMASNGADALERIDRTGCPELIVTDVRMPRMNGLELTRAAKNRCSSLRVIVLAASDYRSEAFAAGCDDYLSKPFELDVLSQKIESLLGRAD